MFMANTICAWQKGPDDNRMLDQFRKASPPRSIISRRKILVPVEEYGK
jgi:hypothetical protein